MNKMSTKAETVPGGPEARSLSIAEDAIVDPIELTGGSHLLDAPPWDDEKEKVLEHHKKKNNEQADNMVLDIARSLWIPPKAPRKGYPYPPDASL